jgi:hypothetical protein
VTIMTIRKLILGSLVATAMAGIALPAAARSNVDVYLGFGPPPVYYEAVPAPRPGWVWVPGYWDWRGHRHHWIGGHWVRARPGHVYYGPRWRHYDNGWHFTRGEWRRWDVDGDGIPNRRDRFPHNPYRR